MTDGRRTCFNCLRLHSMASLCPYRTNRFISLVRQWESGNFADEVLSPEVRKGAGRIARECDQFTPETLS